MMLNHNISFKRIMLSLILITAFMFILSACKSDEVVLVESIEISAENNATTISTLGGTLQFTAIVLPPDADDKSVIWSVENGTGEASISDDGLLTAESNGTVIVRATSNENSDLTASKLITISNQDILATEVNIQSAGNVSVINSFGGTLQFTAVVLPTNADDKSVVWSVEDGTGEATISSNGLLTAVSNGTVTVKAAVSTDASIYDEMVITISNQEVLINSISVIGLDGASTITTIGGTLQMEASILPQNADDKSIIWSVENGTGEATISANGLLTAVSDGTVIVKATSVNQPSISGTRTITISNQMVVVTSLEISTEGDSLIIDTFGGTLQFSVYALPLDAVDRSVVWSVENGTGEATISATGLLTAVSNGTVTVKATAVSDSSVVDTLTITISNQEVMVSSIEISSALDATTIDTYGGTLQFSASVLPLDAADKSVVWSLENGTGEATLSASGLLTAVSNGTVTVKVSAGSDASIFDTMVITISNQEILISSISVIGFDDISTITTIDGTLQMVAVILPSNATDQSVIWSVASDTGEATINQEGLLTAVANGTVIVMATSVNQPGVSGTYIVTISNQEIVPTSVQVNSAGDVVIIDTFGGTLQFTADVLPLDAVDKTVTWSVENGTGEAVISVDGLLTAVSSGTVTVKATANADLLIFDTMVITISNQEISVTSIVVSSEANATVIDTFGGTLQMYVEVLPLDATDKSVVWSVENGTGEATISLNGLLTAVSNGTVTVKATSVSDPLVFGSMVITLSSQEILVTSITVTTVGNISVIEVDGGTLQMVANVLPLDATDQSVVWSVENGTGEAMINQDGLLTALVDGTVIVKATSGYDALIFGTKEITLSNQVVAPEPVVGLGTAGEFTILAKTGISTAADSLVIGNIGVSPVAATYITGFSLILHSTTTYATSAQVTGMVYAADYSAPTPAYLTTAVSDMETAYIDAAGRAPDFTELYAGDLSGQTLVGGVYKYSNDVVIYSNLTLSGSADDVWIFQISGNLTQAVSVEIILAGGAQAKNVFWQVAGSVAIETSAHFTGILLSMTQIALGTNATVNGKLLSQTAVTLDANTIGLVEIIDVTSIVLTSEANAVVIDTLGGSLQMYAEVLPIDATNKGIVWTVENGTGAATISDSGFLSAVSDGTVTVKATSATDPLIFDTMVITISNQEVLVTSVVVSSAGDAIVINTLEGTLQMYAEVLPLDATNKDVLWTVENGTGQGAISATGLLTAVANGTVLVKATSVENPLIFGSLEITISNQEILVTSVVVTSEANAIVIDTLDGTLQMYAEVLPIDATDKSVVWSVENGTGQATISAAGLLTAVANGTVLVKATSVENPLIFGSLEITISNQAEVVIAGSVNLGSASDFTILSKTGLSTTVGTMITGNIGVSPGPASYITGFGLIMDASGEFATSSLVVGMVYASDYAAPTPTYLTTAVSDMQTAYTDAAGRARDFVELHAGDISGQTLVPGVYYWSSGLLINTNVILSGSATDLWIFQIDGTITQAANVSIILQGGALAENIVWQVASAVSIGAGAHFEGTILGMTSVNIGTSATYNGKIFAQTAVTLDANTIN